MRWRSVVVRISRQLDRRGVLVAPKTAAGVWTMAAPQWLHDDLTALMVRRSLSDLDREALLFVSDGCRPLDDSNWRSRSWVPACRRAGLAELRFHDLRFLNASVMVVAGVDSKTAQKLLGHASPTVTLGI